MNRTRKAQALSAAAAATVAMAGFAPSPASASVRATPTEPAAGLTTAGAPQTVRDVQAAKLRGFVPRAHPNAVVSSTCSGHTCIGVTHSGSTAFSVGEHFFNWPGVHYAHIHFNSPEHLNFSKGYFGSHQEYLLSHFSFSHVQSVCGNFNTVPPAPGSVCVRI
jgi:hypothetical protein